MLRMVGLGANGIHWRWFQSTIENECDYRLLLIVVDCKLNINSTDTSSEDDVLGHCA